jgi:ADP-ribose pyrophosphatase
MATNKKTATKTESTKSTKPSVAKAERAAPKEAINNAISPEPVVIAHPPKPAKALKSAKRVLPKKAAKAAEAKAEPSKQQHKTKAPKASPQEKTARVLDSKLVYEGPLFRVQQDHLIEPGGRESHRDVIRHNGSVVILAIDKGKRKKDPWVVVERQYRHAAGQFLWELPAGKLDAGESPLNGARRELAEETGYDAKKWSPLVEYYASPGFLGEAMKVFLAEGLIAGDAHPEEDEHIDFRLVRLSEILDMVDEGKIIDGKTLTSILIYARELGVKRKK